MSVVKTDFASLIAKFLISLNAVGYDLLNPIKWASGTYNPFYVDNRKLQSSPEARKILRKALALLVEGINVDYVYGIPKAGIAPAVLLCLEIKKPLLIKHNKNYYQIDVTALELIAQSNLTYLMKDSEVVGGTVPFGTILGIVLAEQLQKPFLFIREKPKEHGLQNQIEGVVNAGDFCTLVDPIVNGNLSYSMDAAIALRDKNIQVSGLYNPNIDMFLQPVDLVGKNIVGMEDLVSTGGSGLTEIIALQDMGAFVQPCSIFSYDLPSAIKNFGTCGLRNKSVLNFEGISMEFDLQKKWALGDKIKIENWHSNQETWGYENGFPSK